MAIELKAKYERNRYGYGSYTYEVEDPEIDSIYDSLSYLKVDIKHKIEELQTLYSELEDAMQEAGKKFFALDDGSAPDEEDEEAYKAWKEEYDEAEEAYNESVEKFDAVEHTLDQLQDLLDKLD